MIGHQADQEPIHRRRMSSELPLGRPKSRLECPVERCFELLRLPGGFEGLLVIEEGLDSQSFAVL
jgi:hypothetical protein